LHEGNEVTTGILPFALRASGAVQIRSRRICQGKYGKQGWSIARRFIAVAMDQGGSIKIGSQIFPDFVQVQTVFFIIHDLRV